MKAGREHRVPLSKRSLAIIEALAGAKTCEYVFPSPRGRRPLSHVAMAKVMDRLNVDGPTVHGFRSAFQSVRRGYRLSTGDRPEAALAHVIGDKAEQAYRRGDALEKRRKLMDAWAASCEPKASSSVVRIEDRRKVAP